jgi:5-methyltetrahydropteroyltriglutamate--homocysteine methyltransferase
MKQPSGGNPVASTDSKAKNLNNQPRRPARAEIIGSLLKPPRLYEHFDRVYTDASAISTLDSKHREGLEALNSVAEEEIKRVVAKQIDCGLDVISDGELRRAMFTNSFYDAIDGVEITNEPVPFHDDEGNTIYYQGAPIIARRLRMVDSPAGKEAGFMRSLTTHPFKVTFPAASFFCLPYLYQKGITDQAYSTPDELVQDALEIQRRLVGDAVKAGATYVQFDWPAYAILVDESWRELMKERWDVEPEDLFARSLAADRAVLEGIPDNVAKGLHFCRGNYKSHWISKGPLDFVAERMFDLPYDTFLIEWDDVSREGDFSTLRHVPKGGPTVVVGIVSSKKPKLESEDSLLERIDEAVQYVDVDQLAISPQCGFASVWHGNEMTEDDQWRKLELVSRVADRVWAR